MIQLYIPSDRMSDELGFFVCWRKKKEKVMSILFSIAYKKYRIGTISYVNLIHLQD